jgi:parallel beta-helix repeat protein
VADELFGLLVIQGPEATSIDTDGDGVVDFFDAFPTDSHETQDTDGDRMGNNDDVDDDNDSFSDAEELSAIPPSNPLDPLSFPIRVPPSGVTVIVVDAFTLQLPRERMGTPESPYRSITEALLALRSGLVPEVERLRIRAGTYSPQTTNEVIPIDLGRLSHLTVEAETPGSVVLDGAFRGDVMNAEFSHHLAVEGLVFTHGANGITVRESSHVTLRHNQSQGNTVDGMRIGLNANTDIVVTDNLMESNGQHGLRVIANAAATVTQNISRSNIGVGILIAANASAEIIDNIVTANDDTGIAVVNSSTATVAGNLVEHSRLAGLLIVVDSTGTVMQNTFRMNGAVGIAVGGRSAAELRDNIVVSNGGIEGDAGIAIVNDAVADISGGVISQNRGGGIWLGPDPFGSLPATATIGLEGPAIQIANNGGAGIFVADNGSEATIDSRNIVFSNNAEGDTIGNVTDIAP